MFTQDQINQLQQLFESNNKVIREEINTVRKEQHEYWLDLTVKINDLKEDFKDLRFRVRKLEEGLEELRAGQEKLRFGYEELKKGQDKLEIKLVSLTQTVIANGKTLKYVKNKLNYTAKTVNIMARSYNNEIVENKIRIERMEKRLRISQQ